MRKRCVAAVLIMGWPLSASALEFRTLTEAAVGYDAPSLKAKKLYVLGRDYPVEAVVAIEGWVKVRDASGEMTWLESRLLSDRRCVLVKVPLAAVHETADANSKLLFQAEQQVALELVEVADNGWVKVRHRDGQSGYVRLRDVWGVQ